VTFGPSGYRTLGLSNLRTIEQPPTRAGATRHIELFPVMARGRMLRRCKDKGSRLSHSSGLEIFLEVLITWTLRYHGVVEFTKT